MSGKTNEFNNMMMAVENLGFEMKKLRLFLENQQIGTIMESVAQTLDSIDGTLELCIPDEDE